MSTTTDLSTLKINFLTKAQYDNALENNQINENEIYFTEIPPEGEYLCITGGNVTGPTYFGDSVEIDELTVGDLIVNGKVTAGSNMITASTTDLTPGTSALETGTLYVVYS